jgi:DNA-binding CsgD family transcriptional regulator
MPGRLSSRVFVGRSEEVAELQGAYERVAGGAAAAVLVGGEAGVGKTRLLGELTSWAHDAGARVLVGQCADLRDAAIPLLPIADALGTLAEQPGRAPGAADAEAPPELIAVGRGVAPSAGAFVPVVEVLRALAQAAPVLLALEDVHWADRSTLDLLTFLVGRLRDERLLLVATYRSDEVDRREPLRRFLAEAARRSRVERLELARLTPDEALAQLEGILESAPARPFADAIFARSEGNPLFAEELVSAAEHEGAERLPGTLRDMLLARIDGLSGAAQGVVRAAAVGGRRVHHELLADAIDLDAEQLTRAIREAVRDHVLVADGNSVTFRHPLLQEAAYGELVPGEGARLHAAYARAIERRPELAGGTRATVAAEIAHHWLHAGDRPRALGASVRAGLEAERADARAEAADHLTRALELWDTVPDAVESAGLERPQVLERAAEAAAWSGSPRRAIELVSAGLKLVDVHREPERAALLHERRGFYLWWDGRGVEGFPDYEDAVRLMPAEPPSADRAFVLAGLGFALMLMGQCARSREVCEQALTMARTVGARPAEVRALATLGSDVTYLGDRTAGIAHLREARALGRELGDPDLLAQTAIALSDALRHDGRFEEAMTMGLEGAEDADRAGLGAAQGAYSALNGAEAAFELGRWDVVERVTGSVLAERASDAAVGAARLQHALLGAARGDFAAAHEGLRVARDLLGAAATPEMRAYTLALEAEIAVWERQPEAASCAAAEACELGTQVDVDIATRSAALGIRAEADRAERARAGRDAGAAQAAIERARGFERSGAAGGRELLLSIEAELARAEGRADPVAWEAAATAWETGDAPFRAAYARWRWAEALLAGSGGREAAADALRDARSVAQRLGAQPLLGEIDALARRTRIDLNPAGAPAADAPPRAELPEAARELGLTPRELEVLEHVALGQTNREIAAELFISARTAGVHVSHILEKLGASTRTEAAAAAHRLGLAP